MHIQVITAVTPHGVTDRAKDVIGEHGWMSETVGKYSTVHAEAYGTKGLIEILDVHAADGNAEILVLNCSTEQIQAALKWQFETEEVLALETLVLHLVRKNPTKKSTG